MEATTRILGSVDGD